MPSNLNPTERLLADRHRRPSSDRLERGLPGPSLQTVDDRARQRSSPTWVGWPKKCSPLGRARVYKSQRVHSSRSSL